MIYPGNSPKLIKKMIGVTYFYIEIFLFVAICYRIGWINPAMDTNFYLYEFSIHYTSTLFFK